MRTRLASPTNRCQWMWFGKHWTLCGAAPRTRMRTKRRTQSHRADTDRKSHSLPSRNHLTRGARRPWGSVQEQQTRQKAENPDRNEQRFTGREKSGGSIDLTGKRDIPKLNGGNSKSLRKQIAPDTFTDRELDWLRELRHSSFRAGFEPMSVSILNVGGSVAGRAYALPLCHANCEIGGN